MLDRANYPDIHRFLWIALLLSMALAGYAHGADSWTDQEIRSSRLQYQDPTTLPDKPVFTADPFNLFVVVETADHHITLLDGDTFDPIHRFATRPALHGNPKFTHDGRYAFFVSRDGWVSKYDLWNLQTIAEVRVGLDTRNVAVSTDGNYVAVANTRPHTLVLLDGNLNLLKTLPAISLLNNDSSRVSAVYNAPSRRSFIVALKDIPELWEVSYDPTIEDIPLGMVHDFHFKEGTFIRGYLNPRRIRLNEPLDNFFFTEDYHDLFGVSAQGKAEVINLDARKKIADLPLDGMPHLGSGIVWHRQGKALMASTNLYKAEVAVLDLADRRLIQTIPIKGPGFFLRGHENSRFIFVDSMLTAPTKHILQVIDRDTLTVVREIEGIPGKALAHVEFSRDGRYALASLWDNDGAVIVLDAQTLKEVKRLPMKRPTGKYNLWNKIRRDENAAE